MLVSVSASLMAQPADEIIAQQGGFGGDLNQRQADVFPNRQGETINDSEAWQSKSIILTQGDTVEWKVSGKKGQTVFATVTSDVFDPALAIVDSKGKQLALNDDQRDGDQSPFLAFYFPDDEEYKITVKNYRSTAGGKFMLFSRFIKPVTVGMGVQTLPCKDYSDDKQIGEKYFRFHGEKGKIYTFEAPQLLYGNNRQRMSLRRIIGPTGVMSNDFQSFPYPNGNQIFEAKADGDYYIAYAFYSQPSNIVDARSFVTCLGTSEIQKIDKASTTKVHFDPHQFKIFRFPVESGDLVQTTYASTGEYEDYVTAPIPENPRGFGEDQNSFRTQGYIAFKPMLAGRGDLIRLFGAKGDVTMIYYGSDKGTDLTITNKTTFPELQAGSTTKEVMLGQSHFSLLKVKKGDNIKLSTTANSIEPTLDLIRLDGYRQSYIDRENHKFSQRMYFPDDATYLMVMGAAGGGGSGSIKIDLLKASPKVYALDTIGHGDDSDEVMNTFTVKLEKGQLYQILMEKGSGFEIIEQDGSQSGQNASGQFGGTSVRYFTAGSGGECRLRLPGATKDTRFKISKYTAPKIDGG